MFTTTTQNATFYGKYSEAGAIRAIKLALGGKRLNQFGELEDEGSALEIRGVKDLGNGKALIACSIAPAFLKGKNWISVDSIEGGKIGWATKRFAYRIAQAPGKWESFVAEVSIDKLRDLGISLNAGAHGNVSVWDGYSLTSVAL